MPIELVGTQANSSQKFPPDAEIIFREWAINTTNITAVCSTRVATRLPRNATLPFLTFFNNGGTLMNPQIQAAVVGVSLQVDAYAGRWGGASGTSQPDYAKAYALANEVAESAFKTAQTRVRTATTNTKAIIYGFEIPDLPSRIEETETGLGHYTLSLIMYYRGLD